MTADPRWRDQVEAADAFAQVDPATFPRTDVPDWITLSGISDLAFRLFVIIKAHQSKDRPKPFPGQKTLAAMLGYAKTDSVADALQELREIGAITSELRPCPAGRRTHYTLHEVPAIEPESFDGPRKTSDLYGPGVLEAIGEARAKRKRGVVRNQSGLRKVASRGAPLVKGHPR